MSAMFAVGLMSNAYAQKKTTVVSDQETIVVRGKEIRDRDVNDDDLKSKEVSMMVDAPKSADIFIENSSRNIIIKVWEQPKVKVTTMVYYEGNDTKLTDEEWLDKVNLNVKAVGSSIRVKSGAVGGGYSYGTTSGVAIFDSYGQNIRTKSNGKRIVTVYIPKENKLDIESKYCDVSINANLNRLSADISNGNLDMQDVNTLSLRSKYSNVSTGNINSAEVEFINGHFSAKNVDDLDIDTKYSSVDLATVKKAMLRSTNDEYEIDEAGVIQGRKNYGNLRITKLNTSIDMDGNNADVRVRNISPSVELIRFDNKYADIRLPLRDLKNYTVTFVGPYSSVYAGFEKKPIVKTEDDWRSKQGGSGRVTDVTVSGYTVRTTGSTRENDVENNFTATVGDGKGTKISLKCQNCTVDFK